jgi:hypothetical protein
LTWNEKSEQNSCELLAHEEILKGARQGGGGEKPVSLMQVKGNLNTLAFFRQNPFYVNSQFAFRPIETIQFW